MDNELQVVARHIAKAPAVNLSDIFEDLGVLYEEMSLWNGASGWIERDGETYKVVVNADEPVNRRRFTAAHELAHYLLHRDLMDHKGRAHRHTDVLFGGEQPSGSSRITRQHEIQANRLAAQILMPANRVKEMWAANQSVENLAHQLHVSRAAMEIRLKNLGLMQ